MGLRACRECGREMSASAKACPHCGALPVGQQIAQSIGAVGCLLILLGLLIPFLLLGGC